MSGPFEKEATGIWGRDAMSLVIAAILAGQTAHALVAASYVFVREQLLRPDNATLRRSLNP
ncbi:hypothetical protein BH23ACT5_BH23ACT5_11040 [soil metagenome]